MRRLAIAILLLTTVPGSACGPEQSGSNNPDAAKGVMSESLNRQQQARLALLGRTSAPTRYTEKIDGNRLRVVAIDFGGTTLGQCSDLAGSLLPGNCMPQGAQGPLATEIIGSEAAPLNSGMFRQYSTQVGTTIEAKVAVGPGATEASYYVSRNFLVLEWRRYNLQELREYPDLGKAKRYFVSALENGVAIRIVFDVTLRTTDAKLSANFGIADLSTALARNEATVEVSYEVLGTDLDLMPGDAITVTSLKEYLDILDEFYRIVGVISEATQIWAAGGGTGFDDAKTAEINLNHGTDKIERKVRIKRNTFKPTVLAYYVSGAGVGENYSELRNVEACEDIRARHQYLKHDLRWHKDMIEHHRSVPVASLTPAGKLALNRAIEEVRDIHTSQRELMAEAASLSCVRTCVANGHRLKQVCPQVSEETTREAIDCKSYSTKTTEQIEGDCRAEFEWVYDKSFPLDVKKPRKLEQPQPKAKPKAKPQPKPQPKP